MAWKKTLEFARGGDVGEGLGRMAEALEQLDAQLNRISGLDAQGAADLRLVCDEIGSNVVRHLSPQQPVFLQFDVEVTESVLRLRISDNGPEFNPLEQPQPYLGDDLNKRGIGGLGLYFIRTLFPHAMHRRESDHNVIMVEYHLFGP